MQRSASAKVVNYKMDGTGRDIIIGNCNGGFMSSALLLKTSPSKPKNPLNPQWKLTFRKDCHTKISNFKP